MFSPLFYQFAHSTGIFKSGTRPGHGRGRAAGGGGGPVVIGGGGHVEDDLAARYQLVVGEEDFVERLAVQFGSADVRMLRAVLAGGDSEGFAPSQRERGAVEEGAADGVGGVTRANRIEAEGAENVPGRGLAGVLVAAQAVGGGLVKLVHDQAGAGLGFPGLAGSVVEVNYMVDGLVAVGVLAHVERGHFNHLV